MPFPPEACSYRGGCNCRAIRYRVTIPEYTHRPDNPYDKPEPYSKLPMVAICHCNDCRRTHSSPFGFALINCLDWVEFSLTPISTPPVPSKESGELASQRSARDQADEARTWTPATSIFDFNSESGPTDPPDTWLRFYKASPKRARGFCGRCGTQLCYFVFGESEKLPKNWIPQLDLWAGAVDRCDLEKDWFVPERELWLDFGIAWAKQFTGHETPILPRFGRF